MGNDPHSSVVNRNCQLHDVDNVFVIDGSVHVTNGGFNPGAHHHGRRLLRLRCAGPQLEGHGIPLMKRFLKLAAHRCRVSSSLCLVVVGIYGASYYYTSQHGQGCASCHEMAAYVTRCTLLPHRNAACMDCHEASLATKLRHIRVHLFGNWPESSGCATWTCLR